MKSALCVIDMQPYFRTSGYVLDGVLAEIAKFKSNGFPIFLIEYDRCGPSYSEIYDSMVGYTNLHFLKKNDDGGGKHILDKAKRDRVRLSNVTICGVNICYCVKETAAELVEFGNVKVKLAKSASHCSCGDGADCIELFHADLGAVWERKKNGSLADYGVFSDDGALASHKDSRTRRIVSPA
jgi:nicotinamidase-related amidase